MLSVLTTVDVLYASPHRMAVPIMRTLTHNSMSLSGGSLRSVLTTIDVLSASPHRMAAVPIMRTLSSNLMSLSGGPLRSVSLIVLWADH